MEANPELLKLRKSASKMTTLNLFIINWKKVEKFIGIIPGEIDSDNEAPFDTSRYFGIQSLDQDADAPPNIFGIPNDISYYEELSDNSLSSIPDSEHNDTIFDDDK